MDKENIAANSTEEPHRMTKEDVASQPVVAEAFTQDLDVKQLLHELQIHKIELEMQKEQLHRAQAELAAERARYLDLHDQAPVGYCTISEQGLILQSNLTAATLLGLARGALVKQSITRFILPEDLGIYRQYSKQLFETCVPQACELRMIRHDGTQFWARIEATAAQTPSKRSGQDAEDASVSRVVLSDISKRRQAEIAMRASEERFRLLVNTIPDLIWLKDAEGVYLTCNKMFERFFGAKEADITGKTDYDFVDRELADYFREHDRKAMAAGKPSSNEEWITFADDGHRALLDTKKTPMHDADGKLIGVLGVSRDITDRKYAEEERAKLESQFQQQSRLAAMGEMINNIAHQWRQPLNGLGLLIQEMRIHYDRDHFSKECLDINVDKSMNLIEHMSQTIDDFRNFFKPDKKKVKFTIQEVVKRTVSLVEDSFKDHQIRIALHIRDNPAIFGFPNEYSQALVNILTNARDALLERHPDDAKVTVTISNEGERAVVTIADNAGGIPEEIMGKIFEPHFTTKGSDRGTGIGLFMSKTIIEKNMNGRLTARNTAEGAEFRIEA